MKRRQICGGCRGKGRYWGGGGGGQQIGGRKGEETILLHPEEGERQIEAGGEYETGQMEK